MSTAIRRQVAAAIPDKEILIGEIGWPSAGPHARGGAAVAVEPGARHQRDAGARASARISRSTSSRPSISRGSAGSRARSAAIGAFSTARSRRRNSAFGGAVSDHPQWLMQAVAGVIFAAVIFAAASSPRSGKRAPSLLWPRIALLAFPPAVLFGWTLERDAGRQFHHRRLAARACFARRRPLLRRSPARPRLPLGARCQALRRCSARGAALATALGLVLGGSLIALTLAVGRDRAWPRFRSALPGYPVRAAERRHAGVSDADNIAAATGRAARCGETLLAAAVLVIAAVYIAFNETLANWQALWLCAGFAGLAFILPRARDAPG